jgi:hypothetical protein
MKRGDCVALYGRDVYVANPAWSYRWGEVLLLTYESVTVVIRVLSCFWLALPFSPPCYSRVYCALTLLPGVLQFIVTQSAPCQSGHVGFMLGSSFSWIL